MGLGLTGAAQIIAVDIHAEHLALTQALGATDVIDATRDNVPERIVQITRGSGLDGALETSGNLGALRSAIAGLASAGTCVVVEVPGSGISVDVDVIRMVQRGLRIIGTNQGGAVPRVVIPQLVELYLRGRLPVDKIVTSFDFAHINEAAEASLSGRVIKPVLHM